MGNIIHNYGKDFIIESKNGKKFKIEEELLLENTDIENNWRYNGDDIYNNEVLSYLQEIFNDKFELCFKDLDFGEEKIVFNYTTFIDDEFYEINGNLIEDLYKVNKNKTIRINLDLLDNKKNISYDFGIYDLTFGYTAPGFMSSASYELTIYESIYYNKEDFIKWFANNYLSANTPEGIETFDY